VPPGVTFNLRVVFLVAFMLASLTAAVSGALQRLFPGWQPIYLVIVCFLIGLEAGTVHYVARSTRLTTIELARYLVPELFIMAVVMRLIASLSIADVSLADDLQRWLYDPLSVFDAAFGAFMVAGVVVGALAHLSIRDLNTLALLLPAHPSDDDNRRLAALVAVDRSLALERIGARFVIGGALLLIALAGEAVNTTTIGGPPRPLAPLSIAASLTYVVSGFVLYSRARLVVLQAKWTQEGAHVAPLVEQRWVRSSWALILLIVAGAALLPRSYALGLLDTLRAFLGVLGYALAMIGYVLTWILALILSLPAWILALFAPDGAPAASGLPPPLPVSPPSVERDPNLLAALVFWACMLLLAGYALAIVAQRHTPLLQRFGIAATIRALIAWLRSIWQQGASWATLAIRAADEALRRPSGTSTRHRRTINLRRLPPRERVRYFYLATLRRAAQCGVERHPSQTPYEYAARLGRALPEAASDIDDLTDVFITAQYSPHICTENHVVQARRPWERLRRTLRSRRSRLSKEVHRVDDAP